MSTLKTWQKSRVVRLGLAPALGLALLTGIVLTLGDAGSSEVALAQSPCNRYVAPPPTGDDSGNDCATSSAPCATVQHAVDEADPGDVICVASGEYTDVHVRPRNDIEMTGVVTQVVYIDETVTVRGGYTTAFAEPPDPEANPTTLDAGGQGRVLYITGDIRPTIEGLALINGDASGLGGLLWGSVDWDAGGGGYVISATVSMSNNQVSDNFAHGGGGLHFQNCPDPTLTGNTISNNRAGPEAGGVGWGGGAYFIKCSKPELTNNTVSENGATWGGGLYFSDSPKAMLSNNTISNNVANHVGGGMKFYGGVYFYLSDDATLIGNTIRGNRAANQCGGVCFTGGKNAMLVGNTIISNSAGSPGFSVSEGGGLFFAGSTDAKLMGNTISENRSYTCGGGIYDLVSTIALIGNRINSNQAKAGGGALCLDRTETTLTNNVVADNQVEPGGTGSGLYIVDSSPHLLHTTIARNSGGDSSGVHVAGTLSTVAMTNTIVATHEVGIKAVAGNTVTVDGVLWFNNGSNVDGPVAVLPGNEYTGDPAFAGDGYHLTLASAAIDKGLEAGVKRDIDGEPRSCHLAPDLGADENCPLYLPIIMKNR